MNFEEEGWIEASLYAENYEASPKEKDTVSDRELNDISRCFGRFDEVREIKERFLEVLSKHKIREAVLDGFKLGTMEVINALSKDTSIEEFLRQSYVGCFQCLLCLQSDNELYRNSQRLLQFLSDALRVIGHVVSEQGWHLPSLRSEARDYKESKLVHLSEFTDCYLRTKPNYELLRKNEQLIKDVKVVSEIDFALGNLRIVLEELQRAAKENPRRVNEFMLFAQMEENIDLSGCC